jgi:SAM-dependent methyltransferase
MSSEAASCWICGGATAVDPEYANTPLIRCTQCGFLFSPQRSAEELQALYADSYFETYAGHGDYASDPAQRRHEARRRLEWIAEWAPPPGNLLEIGSAAGFFLDEARSDGYTVAGIEPGEAVSAYSREQFGLDVRTTFLEQAELPAAHYDVICAFHVLEHIYDPHDFLRLLRASIADDGHLMLEIPNIASALARHLGSRWFHLDPMNHVGFYEPEHLRRLLGECGFELLDTHTVSEYHYVRSGLRRKPKALAGRAYKRAIVRRSQAERDPVAHSMLRIAARAA